MIVAGTEWQNDPEPAELKKGKTVRWLESGILTMVSINTRRIEPKNLS